MPGIDKLPIEETLEDSPQVRCGRRRAAREGAGLADPRPGAAAAAGTSPGLGGRRPQVPPPVAGGAPIAEAGPPYRGPRGPAPLGREPRAGSGTSAGCDRAAAALARGPGGHIRARGSLVFDKRCFIIAVM